MSAHCWQPLIRWIAFPDIPALVACWIMMRCWFLFSEYASDIGVLCFVDSVLVSGSLMSKLLLPRDLPDLAHILEDPSQIEVCIIFWLLGIFFLLSPHNQYCFLWLSFFLHLVNDSSLLLLDDDPPYCCCCSESRLTVIGFFLHIVNDSPILLLLTPVVVKMLPPAKN